MGSVTVICEKLKLRLCKTLPRAYLGMGRQYIVWVGRQLLSGHYFEDMLKFRYHQVNNHLRQWHAPLPRYVGVVLAIKAHRKVLGTGGL